MEKPKEIFKYVIRTVYASHFDASLIGDCKIIIENNTKLIRISHYRGNTNFTRKEFVHREFIYPTTLTTEKKFNNVKLNDTIKIYVDEKDFKEEDKKYMDKVIMDKASIAYTIKYKYNDGGKFPIEVTDDKRVEDIFKEDRFMYRMGGINECDKWPITFKGNGIVESFKNDNGNGFEGKGSYSVVEGSNDLKYKLDIDNEKYIITFDDNTYKIFTSSRTRDNATYDGYQAN